MLSFRSQGYSGYSVQYSPFFDSKIALGTAANFGLVGNGRLYVLDIDSSGNIIPCAHYDTQDGVFAVAWSESNENQIAAGGGDGSIKLFDIAAPNFPVRAFHTEHSKEVYSLSWNMVNRSMFCSASWDGTIRVWTPDRMESVGALAVARTKDPRPPIDKRKGSIQDNIPATCIYDARFSPRSPTVLASAQWDSSVQIWDIRTGAGPTLRIPDAHGTMECLTVDWNKYRPTVLLSGGVDNIVKVWDTRNPRLPTNEFVGHEYPVKSAAWSPHSGDIALSTSYDMTARVWKDQTTYRRGPHSNRQLNLFNKHTEFVIDCDWSLWGEPGWVATVGWDEMLYVWKAI